jgi:hypothetical protein
MKVYFAAAFGMAACFAAFGQAPPAAGAAAYAPSRTAGGQPDLSGIWQYIGPATFDLEDHSPRMGVPAGYGVVEGGRIPYLPDALKQRDKNFEDRATADPTEAFCYRPGVPRATLMPFPFQILQFPNYTEIVYEYLGVNRQLFYKGKHPDPDIDSFWMGDSRAHWEGNTLVVDVTNFNDQTWFDQAGNFHSDALHVVERYTRTSPDIMTYEATIEDPNVFSRPWKIHVPLYRRQETNLRLLEYQCHTYMEEEAAKGKIKIPWSHLPLEGVPPYEGIPQSK